MYYNVTSFDYIWFCLILWLFQVLTLSVSSNDKFIAVGMGNLLQISMRNEPGKLEESLDAARAENAGLEYHKKYLQSLRFFYL